MKKQNGMTLVEVLAALVLVSILLTLVMGIVINTQHTFNRQQLENLNTANMTLVLNNITSEVRKNPDDISIVSEELIITPGSEPAISYSLDEDSNALLRNDVLLSSNITDFNVKLENNVLTVSMEDAKSKTWETRIVLRSGTQ